MKIVRTSVFEKSLKRLGASKTDLAKLEDAIAKNPQAGDVIQGLNGARKIRFAMGGKGKSGGGRAIYIAVITADTAYLLLAYRKNDQTDLSPDQRKAIAAVIEELKDA
ncbi:MAG TPA: type II toxin-antitoxin system RelE/ParE family toxin [Rhizomicrobium sp.]